MNQLLNPDRAMAEKNRRKDMEICKGTVPRKSRYAPEAAKGKSKMLPHYVLQD